MPDEAHALATNVGQRLGEAMCLMLVAAGRGDVPDEAHALATNVGQRRVPTESVKIGVKYMPTSGNILINETTDPNGIVLEARSGRFYPPAQIHIGELLSDPVRLAHATEQAQYSRTQRDA